MEQSTRTTKLTTILKETLVTRQLKDPQKKTIYVQTQPLTASNQFPPIVPKGYGKGYGKDYGKNL